ncbi:RNase H domain-containing protein [Trichonephila clavipes]|nr:RNase H domain-containing protein [Trichonephila clavipes]
MTTSIVQGLNSLSAIVKIFFLWVPSHVNVCGNEIADVLARDCYHKDSTRGGCLTLSEIATRVKQDISSSWRQAHVHEWLRSEHIRAQRHMTGFKAYPPCPDYNVTQSAPVHILACIGCHNSLLLSSPATVLHCLKTHWFRHLI